MKVTSHASACGPKGRTSAQPASSGQTSRRGPRGSREDEATIGPNPSGVNRRSIRAKLYVLEAKRGGHGGVGRAGCVAVSRSGGGGARRVSMRPTPGPRSPTLSRLVCFHAKGCLCLSRRCGWRVGTRTSGAEPPLAFAGSMGLSVNFESAGVDKVVE